ncbi:MAG TPA: hydrolase 1, exosortase A system-associated [Burkholderiaceae bacterium]|nr:hydrolase 1, exosortase A system-associated [Burkholderiaceae bacterium]
MASRSRTTRSTAAHLPASATSLRSSRASLRPDPARAYEATATFEPGPGGPRFVLTHRPLRVAERGTVILAPPFAEEMNKCRRMVAQTARALSADGWRVVQPDLYGCGDSAGDFGAASWQQWVEDLQRALGAYHAGGELWLWGVRAGALLLPPLLEAIPDANLLLWQPAHDGAAVLNQFLRLRASAALLERNETADRAQLRARLAQGESIEVAGYPLSPQVANPLAAARLVLPPDFSGRVVWFDISDDPAEPLSASRQKVSEAWRAAGHRVQFEAVIGPKFWQTVETAEAPALIERTRAALAQTDERARAGSRDVGRGQPAPASSQRTIDEKAVWIACEGERMLGIVCAPRAAPTCEQAVLIAVGGPQYRVGSHRQFVLLARTLASAGYTSMRFDFRSMGDSEGAARTFEEVERDLQAAIDTLCNEPGVRSVVIWALCDAASAALMFGTADARVSGLVLLNPWVRSETTLATTHLKHYYGQRLLQREFWVRLMRAQFDWRASLRDLFRSLRRAARASAPAERTAFQTRMAEGWRRFRGPIALVLSGRDLTAKEFLEHAASDPGWQGLLTLPTVRRFDLPDADHTFSSAPWHRWLEEQTVRWLGSTYTASVAQDECRGVAKRSAGAPVAVGGSP